MTLGTLTLPPSLVASGVHSDVEVVRLPKPPSLLSRLPLLPKHDVVALGPARDGDRPVLGRQGSPLRGGQPDRSRYPELAFGISVFLRSAVGRLYIPSTVLEYGILFGAATTANLRTIAIAGGIKVASTTLYYLALGTHFVMDYANRRRHRAAVRSIAQAVTATPGPPGEKKHSLHALYLDYLARLGSHAVQRPTLSAFQFRDWLAQEIEQAAGGGARQSPRAWSVEESSS